MHLTNVGACLTSCDANGSCNSSTVQTYRPTCFAMLNCNGQLWHNQDRNNFQDQKTTADGTGECMRSALEQPQSGAESSLQETTFPKHEKKASVLAACNTSTFPLCSMHYCKKYADPETSGQGFGPTAAYAVQRQRLTQWADIDCTEGMHMEKTIRPPQLGKEISRSLDLVQI